MFFHELITNTIRSQWNQEQNRKTGIKPKSYTESLFMGVVAVAVMVVLTVVEVAGTVSGFGSGSGWGNGGCMWLVRGGSRMWVKGSTGQNNATRLPCKMVGDRLLIHTLLIFLYIFSALQLFRFVPVAQLKTAAAAAGVSWHGSVYSSQKSWERRRLSPLSARCLVGRGRYSSLIWTVDGESGATKTPHSESCLCC